MCQIYFLWNIYFTNWKLKKFKPIIFFFWNSGNISSSHVLSTKLTHLFSRNDFRDYAQVCFREFGDRVKHWITLNEPWTYSVGGYGDGSLAPGRCSDWQQLNCTGGDSGVEPYLVAHHHLLAHAAAVYLYKNTYQV